MKEASKLRARWEREGLDKKYLVGSGIDIGCGDDPITPDCRQWDLADGDAQYMNGLPDTEFDWVFSSHCLEHLTDPRTALRSWWRILRPGGYMIVQVPDEDLYEQGYWPSLFNDDHKHSFTIHKDHQWQPDSRNLVELIDELPLHRVVSMQVIDTSYKYEDALYDRTDEPGAEAAIEMIVQKLLVRTKWHAHYDKLIICLNCEWPRVMLEGFKGEKLIIRCPRCGTKGELER